MPNKELVDYIEKEMRKGIHVDRVRETLYEVGHRIEHVDEAIDHIKKRRKRKNFTIIFSAAFVFLLLIAFSFVALYMTNDEKTDIEDTSPGDSVTKDNYYYSEAFKTGDISYCDNIIEGNLKARCMSIEKEVVVPLSEEKKADMDFFQTALEEKDAALCDKIKRESLKESCYKFVDTNS